MLGFRLPAGKLGAAKWAATFAGGWSAATEAYGVYEAGKGLTDGKWEWSDVFNLLTFVPYAVPAIAAVSKSIGTIRAANKAAGGVADDAARAAGSIDDVLRSSEHMETTVGCFVAGTFVLTPEGEKAIDTLQIGDTVLSANPESGQIASHKIVNRFQHIVPVVLDIRIGSTTITCSPEHPFWVPKCGWVEAGKLSPGNFLSTKEGKIALVDSIQAREVKEGPFKVYNIEVDGFHTYYVSELGVLVHNKARKVNKPRLPDKDGYWSGDPGSSDWHSTNPDANNITEGKPIPFKDDYPDFSEWSQAEVDIDVTGKQSTDNRRADKAYAQQQGFLKKNGTPNQSVSKKYRVDNNLTWHHVPGSNKMQLLPRGLHGNIPHTGGAADARNNP